MSLYRVSSIIYKKRKKKQRFNNHISILLDLLYLNIHLNEPKDGFIWSSSGEEEKEELLQSNLMDCHMLLLTGFCSRH